MSETHFEDLMTTAEVAALYRRPEGTIRQWRHRGYGPVGFRLGGTVVYRRAAVQAFLEQCEAAESAPAKSA